MQQKILNNRYELEQKIGEGGMARVYRGRDLRLNRRVAIKVLHSHYANDNSFLRRFHHEAQAAANLHHQNIVDVYDVGQDRDIHYIVMEYVDGSDLKSLIMRNGSLPLDQAVAIGAAAAEGLEAAHRLNMIHRDVKPQNIIIGPDSQVKITDFGIAKSGLSTAMTETGVTFGTADYISPEQARGLPASPRSDIYSLGVTLYEALTGRLPFAGDSSIAVAMQHVSDDPPPLRMYNPRIPPQLEALVLRALSKNADDRPASAREFARLLLGQRSLSEQETIIRPAPQRPAVPQPVVRPPAGRPPATGVTAPRATLPPPRPAVAAQAPTAGGLGVGTFLLGMLLIGVILAGVYLFAIGAFNNLLSWSSTGSTTRSPIPITRPTEGPTPTLEITPTPTPEVLMPSLIGLNGQQARQLLQESSLFGQEDAPRYSDIVSSGLVLDQFPLAGSPISPTTVITYAVSLGRESVQIPEVVGLRATVAQAQLEQAGFLVRMIEEPNDMSEGFVFRTEPSPGLRPPRGETVTLYVSLGNKATVPDVYGLSEEEARRQIEAAGLFISFIDYQGCDKLGDLCNEFGPGTVVSSDPRGNTRVERGTGVTLGVRAP